MQIGMYMVTAEDFVPATHYLRGIDAVLKLSFIYEETAELYSHKYGRPPIDPVVLVKYILLGYLEHIRSERELEIRCDQTPVYRWFIGVDLFDTVPDHSTLSQLRRRKPSFRKVIKRLFEAVVAQCVEAGLVSGKLVATDSTHIKAHASHASEELVEMTETPGAYWERLDAYEEAGLEELKRKKGKRRSKRFKQVKKDNRRTHKWVSHTDPEAGHLKRPGKPEGPHYLAHQTADTDHGIIVGLTVTPGDVHDSVPYLEHLEAIHKNVVSIEAATADSAYDFPLAHQVLDELGITFYVIPQTIAERTKAEFKHKDFSYEQAQDVYLCPNGKRLRLNTLRRSASGLQWVYQANRADCKACPLRTRCLSEDDKRGARKLEHTYFRPVVQRDLSRRDDPVYRQALKNRRIWCEGTFAAQKWGHNLTYVLRRGLEAAEDHCLLSATALNLKRLIRCLG